MTVGLVTCRVMERLFIWWLAEIQVLDNKETFFWFGFGIVLRDYS